jgi:hypothetical protein
MINSFPVVRLKVYYFRRNLNWSQCREPQWTTKIRDVCHRVLFLSVGKFHPRWNLEGPEGVQVQVQLFSSPYTRSLPRPHYLGERNLIPVVQEAGVGLRAVLTGAENLAPTGIQSPYLPSHSESLYRLRYPGPRFFVSFYLSSTPYSF